MITMFIYQYPTATWVSTHEVQNTGGCLCGGSGTDSCFHAAELVVRIQCSYTFRFLIRYSNVFGV